ALLVGRPAAVHVGLVEVLDPVVVGRRCARASLADAALAIGALGAPLAVRALVPRRPATVDVRLVAVLRAVDPPGAPSRRAAARGATDLGAAGAGRDECQA